MKRILIIAVLACAVSMGLAWADDKPDPVSIDDVAAAIAEARSQLEQLEARVDDVRERDRRDYEKALQSASRSLGDAQRQHDRGEQDEASDEVTEAVDALEIAEKLLPRQALNGSPNPNQQPSNSSKGVNSGPNSFERAEETS